MQEPTPDPATTSAHFREVEDYPEPPDGRQDDDTPADLEVELDVDDQA